MITIRTCQVCKKELIKHKNESKARYSKKRFCSTAHARVWMREAGVGWFQQKKRGQVYDNTPNENYPL